MTHRTRGLGADARLLARMQPRIDIREAHGRADYDACVSLQREVWGLADLDITAAIQLIATVHAGGLLLVAETPGEGVIGFSYGFAYTLSKSMDHASGPRDRLIDSYNDFNVWGQSSFDTRHVAVANFVWDLPFFKSSTGLTKAALGGWQVNGVRHAGFADHFHVIPG